MPRPNLLDQIVHALQQRADTLETTVGVERDKATAAFVAAREEFQLRQYKLRCLEETNDWNELRDIKRVLGILRKHKLTD